jgi:hypothetical protein
MNAGIAGSVREVAIYDPWENEWKEGKPEEMKLLLPDFKRSLVVRIRL